MLEQVKINKENLSKVLSLNIDSIFIEENNNIEKVFYHEDSLRELRSCSKLLVAMAIGIAIDRKMLIDDKPISLDTRVYPILKDIVKITNQNNIEKISKWTIRDLLTHQTGYEGQMFNEKCLIDIDKDKVLDYALNYDMPYEVGVRYAYNNIEPFIISVIFEECFNINLSDFINENIFKKLGINEYKWGNYGKYCMAATGLYLKHTDFHKIGELLLNDGKYNNEQIVPKEWINDMITLQVETPNLYKEERVLPKIGGGYYTFISRDGYVFRDGTNGQYIILNKDKNLLITIMSSEKEMKNVTEIFRGII